MIIVIQCAARKRPDAGFMRTADGRCLTFVANPKAAPHTQGIVHALPDDPSDTGETWRARLIEYNRSPDNNPLGLLRAGELYANPAYARLVRKFGADHVYVLSAGWGLISASFLTPNYDITFSMVKPQERYKRRASRDVYHDFMMLPTSSDMPIVFLGGKDYVPLFCALTDKVKGQRTVLFNSSTPPEAPRCRSVRFVTTTRTNWHYECANAIMKGNINLDAIV